VTAELNQPTFCRKTPRHFVIIRERATA